jgi:glycosyltransferase involved in cell wall biosynthesis
MTTKIIYCAPIFGYPPIGGPELKVVNVLVALSNNYQVKLILWKQVNNPEFRVFLESRNIEVIYLERAEFKNLKIESRILTGKFLTAYRLIRHRFSFELQRDRKSIARTISSVADVYKTKVVWFSYANYFTPQFIALRKNRRNLILIADTDSVSSRYSLRGLPFVRFRQKIKLARTGLKEVYNEFRLMSYSTILTAVSEIDAKYYSRLKPSASVAVAYNVVNQNDYELTKITDAERFIIITGSFGHFDSPMDHGTRWFIENVWPLVRSNHPAVRLRIVGKNSNLVWGNLNQEGIDVLGWVPSTKPHISSAVACAVPLWFESGTRYKILEAGILKTPVVTTTLGAEGLDVKDGLDLYIADNPDLFALRLSQILSRGPETEFCERLYRKVLDRYSTSRLEEQVRNIVKMVSS